MYDNYLDGVVGVVEADSYASHMLWREYAKQAEKFALNDGSIRYDWQSTGYGYGANVGEIGGRPIWISLLTNTIDGHKLLFWHVTSPVADYGKCEDWLIANLPPTAFRPDGFINQSDPTNFSNVFPRKELTA